MKDSGWCVCSIHSATCEDIWLRSSTTPDTDSINDPCIDNTAPLSHFDVRGCSSMLTPERYHGNVLIFKRCFALITSRVKIHGYTNLLKLSWRCKLITLRYEDIWSPSHGALSKCGSHEGARDRRDQEEPRGIQNERIHRRILLNNKTLQERQMSAHFEVFLF